MVKTSVGADLVGASRLALEGVAGVTELVEAVHMNLLARAGGVPLLRRAVGPVTGVTRLVYRSVKSITRVTGSGIDLAARRLVPLLAQDAAWPGRDAVAAALNGVLGDRLAASNNPLAISMSLRVAGAPSGRIVVLAHGLCMNGAQWQRDGVDHGATLARVQGYSPVYLDYNSGRHVSLNGRAFGQQLEALVDTWPVPVRELVIVGHSMGGLVARSACHYAEATGQRWRRLLTRLVFLGTPHLGAPLERGGNWIGLLTEGSSYSAPFARLARLRSAGITDLRHGSILDVDWEGRDRFAGSEPALRVPAPAGVRCLAVAAIMGQRGESTSDGLVPLESARGNAGFEAQVVEQTNHMQLLSSPLVGQLMLDWLAA